MERYYTDKGFISKGATLNIKDSTDGKYFMLLPVVDMPETKGAPATQAKTVLSDESVTEVEGLQGQLFITVNSAEEFPLDDVRPKLKQTAIITTPLVDCEITGTGTFVIDLETSPDATVTATSEDTAVATVAVSNNKVTVTGVAAGTTLIDLTTSATGEATSYRTFAVTVVAA